MEEQTAMDSSEHSAALLSFEKVFASGYPYDEPFHPRLNQRLVLAPVLDQFNEEQFAALAASARAVGDHDFFFAEAGTYPDNRESHWPHKPLSNTGRIAFDRFEAYADTSHFTTNALWSPVGEWGILISHEWFASVAGTEEFAHEFIDRYPATPHGEGGPLLTANEQVQILLEDVKSWSDQGWLYEFLTHMYGRDRATELLRQHGLDELMP